MPHSQPPILLVGDQPPMLHSLCTALASGGYEVACAMTAEEALRLTGLVGPLLVLLDLTFGAAGGLGLIPRLLGAAAVPIIGLSEPDGVAQKVAALDAGADDCLEQPVAILELLARIRATLRRAPPRPDRPPAPAPEIRTIGTLAIDRQRRIARVAGKTLRLTPREWDLLVALAERPGCVLTRQELLHGLWGPHHANDVQYLRVLVGRVRGKLGGMAAELQTVPGIGYRLGDP